MKKIVITYRRPGAEEHSAFIFYRLGGELKSKDLVLSCGLNEVDEKDFKLLKDHPSFVSMINDGSLKIEREYQV